VKFQHTTLLINRGTVFVGNLNFGSET